MKMAAVVLGGVTAYSLLASTLAPSAQAQPGQEQCNTVRIGDTESITDCSIWDGYKLNPSSKTICFTGVFGNGTSCKTSYY